jgi:hypothetical protein
MTDQQLIGLEHSRALTDGQQAPVESHFQRPHRVASTWRLLRRGREVDLALDDELNCALDLLTDERVAAGMDPVQARRVAAAELRVERRRRSRSRSC